MQREKIGGNSSVDQKKSLQSSEWLLVISLLTIMASLVFIAKVNAYRAASTISPVDLRQKEILVTVSGAVAKPGVYSVIEGSLIKEVLRKAKPKAHANLKNMGLELPIEAPLFLNIEELSEIVVSVRGAVAKSVELTLPVGSRISDLKSKVSLTAEADKSYFRRRKMLKDGEIIEVPKKTVE